jgi:hypothetical protein
MTVRIIHIVAATLLMILCAVAAVLMPPLWRGVSSSGFPPTMALLLLVLASVLRAWRRWPLLDLISALVCAEFFTLSVIAQFTGFTWLALFDTFNLSNLRDISMFIAVPWLAGLVIGSMLLKARQRGMP